MVVDQLDATDIFGGDNNRPPEAFVGNHAAEMHNPVAYNDAELRWLPFTSLKRRDHTLSNLIVICRRFRNISSETCNSAKQVRARHNADKRFFAYNRQPA